MLYKYVDRLISAKILFPELSADAENIIEMLEGSIREGSPVTLDEKIYTPEKNSLSRDGVIVGELYSLKNDVLYTMLYTVYHSFLFSSSLPQSTLEIRTKTRYNKDILILVNEITCRFYTRERK